MYMLSFDLLPYLGKPLGGFECLPMPA